MIILKHMVPRGEGGMCLVPGRGSVVLLTCSGLFILVGLGSRAEGLRGWLL